MVETLARTNLGDLAAGDPVNLERPVRLADRLGGHLVQGHVDATGDASATASRSPTARRSSRSTRRAEVLRYVVHKGSITVDGVSLTVARSRRRRVRGRGDPAHARGHDARAPRAPGDRVNLEVDLIAKYVEALAAPTRQEATS